MYCGERGERGLLGNRVADKKVFSETQASSVQCPQAFLSPFHSLHYFFRATYLLVNPT